RYLSAANLEGTGYSAGYYQFDETGKMLTKDGPAFDCYFYYNNVKQLAYQLLPYNGNYYFIAENNKFVTSVSRNLSAAMVEGTPFPAGKYDFDETGALITKNGPNADGYFYLNGVKQRAYQLIEFEGDYYYISDKHMYCKGRAGYLNETIVEGKTFADGTPIPAGYYSFDKQGRMIINFVTVENIANVRDIGGYVTMDGKTIKEGLVLRGSEPDGAVLEGNVLNENGLNRLVNEYGVKTQMDLRAEGTGEAAPLGQSVLHKYYDAVSYDAIFTEEGKAKMKTIFEDLADESNYPIYMHCTYGIDRTGTVCYVLEAVLGLDTTQLQNEFALSNWYRTFKQKDVNKIKTGLTAYGGANIKENAALYLLDCGVTQAQIDAIRDIFLEG
ncbi:MAG: tyrosine-protein phosphatase, partial [Clostridia bacterium]|nr:tyrosine-protein phosphatase [Clostridia bacterium]